MTNVNQAELLQVLEEQNALLEWTYSLLLEHAPHTLLWRDPENPAEPATKKAAGEIVQILTDRALGRKGEGYLPSSAHAKKLIKLARQ